MFGNLRTSTKLLLLSGMFIVSLLVAAYGWLAEKQIAIDFARKELIGTRYLGALGKVYAGVLTDDAKSAEVLRMLAAAEVDAAGSLNSAELERDLAAAIRKHFEDAPDGIDQSRLVDTLSKARDLAARIGDNSGLALDPDLDSYYVQKILVKELPSLLLQLGELQTLLNTKPELAAGGDSRVRPLLLAGMIRSTLEEIERDSAAAFGGTARITHSLAGSTRSMIAAVDSYLQAASATDGDISSGALTNSYRTALDSVLGSWTAGQAELKHLLEMRLSDLLSKLRSSLALIALVACLSLVLAVLTYRQIVGPLRQLEEFAGSVRETKDYSLRVNIDRKDEIGQLALAFNTMLEELAAVRQREASEQVRTVTMQAELERAARFTAMGELAASIAHEINQPLAAIVNNASAGLRWLNNRPPNLDEVRLVLGRLVNDGGRCGEIIAGLRAMLKKGSQSRAEIDLNELICGVKNLMQSQLETRGVLIQTQLADDLPRVMADRVQLQQVFLNLFVNAAEAMASISDRERVVNVRSERYDGEGALIAVQDSGIGIDTAHAGRIFDAFFTTKSEGMGMGLSICQSIVQSHGGRMMVSPGNPYGSVFCVILPANGAGGPQ
jgi:signal transduction histidine kinase